VHAELQYAYIDHVTPHRLRGHLLRGPQTPVPASLSNSPAADDVDR
jgi:hypothetical protein